MGNDDTQQEMLKRFVWLEKQTRKAKNYKHLSFVIANHSKRLLPYEQAVVWRRVPEGISIISVSATASINRKSPYIVWLESRLLPWLEEQYANNVASVKKEQASKTLQQDWQVLLMDHVLYCPFEKDEKGQVTAGVLYISADEWSEAQVSFVGELSEIFQYAWTALDKTGKSFWRRQFVQKENYKRTAIGVLIILVLIFIIPIRQTILAPAEVAIHDPMLVSASIDGVIKAVDVKPNQVVKQNQVLFSLDSIALKHQYDKNREALIIAQEKYRRAYQQNYITAEHRPELAVLKLEIEKARNELNYAKVLLEHATIRAYHAGIVIFSAPKHWLGRPIKVGERVMLLAGVDDKQLGIDIPIGDMIRLKHGDKVLFFPNTRDCHSKCVNDLKPSGCLVS